MGKPVTQKYFVGFYAPANTRNFQHDDGTIPAEVRS